MTGTAERAGFDRTFSELPERFNLCSYYLDRNLDEGRADKDAVRVGDAAKTYGEIAARVRALCATLRRDGLRPEERVLFVLPDGFEFVEAWFAALRAGGVFAMVNPLLKEKDYRYYLEYTKAAAVFVLLRRAGVRRPSPARATAAWPTWWGATRGRGALRGGRGRG